MNDYERGSEWRQWDLHIHSPASFHWNGDRFERTVGTPKNQTLVDQMVSALNSAAPDVYCIMDYWTFDGWFELKRRLAQDGAPALRKKVFPGIELRLVSPTKFRLNAHVLFSDEITDQQLLDFRSGLRLDVSGRALSDEALVEVARSATPELLRNKGFSKEDVIADELIALKAGSIIAEINCDSYREAISKVPNGNAIGFMPFDTNDGLVGVDRNEHYSYFIGLFQSSPIFESRNHDLRGAFVNEQTAGNKDFIEAFQAALGKVPRLVVSGSDSHRFTGTPGDNDKRGYGDFPSGKATWIKADPSFKGLQQAIMEPAKRSYIGEMPEKLAEIRGNRTYFIDRVKIRKVEDSKLDAHWLDGCDIPFSSDLTAIIGNKGSGKSALADIIALLGCSRQKQHFSFLKKDRFRGKSGDPSKQFLARLEWLDGSFEELRLDQDPADEKVEMVRYIPQGHFEALCNEHVAGRSNAFENELRAVIFSHLEESTRLGALNFEQLINQQESTFRDQLLELRKQLRRVNQDINAIESQMQPEVMANLKEQLALKQKQIEEHDAQKPPVVTKPTVELSEQQKTATVALERIGIEEKAAAEQQVKLTEQTNAHSAKLRAVRKLKERMKLLQRTFTQFEEEVRDDLAIVGLEIDQIAKLIVDFSKIEELETNLPHSIEENRKAAEKLSSENEKRAIEKQKQNEQLNGPQLKYQQFLQATTAWQKKRDELTGAHDQPETLKGIENRITQLESLPASLEVSSAVRAKLSGEIFDVLEALRIGRAALFMPLHELLDSNHLIRDEYKLRFEATLVSSPEALSDDLFSMVINPRIK